MRKVEAPLLSDEETRQLAKQAQAGDKEAMEKLTNSNYRLIWSVANRYRFTEYEVDELFQIAAIGFLKAVQKYDIEKGNAFSTFAVPKMLGEIQRYFRDGDVIRIPRTIKQVARAIKNNDLYEKPPEEINRILGTDNLELVKGALQFLYTGKLASMQTVLNSDDDNFTIQDTIDMDINGDWFDSLMLKDAFTQLDERERYILHLRYEKDLSQYEVAEILGMSQVHIGRLEKKAIMKMQEYLEAPIVTAPKLPNKKKPPKSRRDGPIGDRDKALHLLKTSTLSCRDISDMTGVPLGSLTKLSKIHRPQDIKDVIRKRATRKKGELNVYGT